MRRMCRMLHSDEPHTITYCILLTQGKKHCAECCGLHNAQPVRNDIGCQFLGRVCAKQLRLDTAGGAVAA